MLKKCTISTLGLLLLLNTTVYGVECGDEKYIVKGGDTLSGIAKEVYKGAATWDIIYYANQNTIGRNPSSIKVGNKLKIPCLKEVKIQKITTSKQKVSNSKSNIVNILSGDNSPPFLDKKSPNGGMITHIVKEALVAGGMKYSNTIINDFSSHFDLLKNKTSCFDVGTNWYKPDCSRKDLDDKTKARCEFKFSDTIFEDIVSFYQKSSRSQPKSIEDFHGTKVCRPEGWMIFDLEEQGLIDTKTITMVWGKSISDCINKLESDEVDYLSITKMSADLKIKEQKANVVEVEGLSSLLSSHLIVHPYNPKADKIIFKFNKGLANLKKSGKLEEIQKNHMINYTNNLNKEVK